MASAAAGRALRAAQPQTEFTTTSVGARSLPSTASTSSEVRSSSNPRLVSSSRIGRTISGSYIGTFRLRMLSSLLEERAECRAKIWSAPAHGVDISAVPEAVFKAQAVELIELLFGERQRRRARFREDAQYLRSLFLEIGVVVDGRRQAQRGGLRAIEQPSGGCQIEGNLLSYRAAQHRHDDRRHKTPLHLRVSELRRFRGQHEVAGRREATATGQRAALDQR